MPRFFLVIWLLLTSTVATHAACAEGERQIRHAGGMTCVVKAPERIFTTHSITLTIAVYELGAGDRLIGHFDLLRDGLQPHVDAHVRVHTSLEYKDGKFHFVNWNDFETLAGLKPDLILARTWDQNEFDKLSAIAPTVMIEQADAIPEAVAKIADVIGVPEAQTRLHADFLDRVDDLKSKLGPERTNLDVAFLTAGYGNELTISRRYGAVTDAMEYLDIEMSPRVLAFHEDVLGPSSRGARTTLSAERIDVADADLLMMPYWINSIDPRFDFETFDHEDGVAHVQTAFEDAVPGYCAFLRVCREDQVIIFEGTPTYTWTYSGLNAALDLIETEIVGREITQIIPD